MQAQYVVADFNYDGLVQETYPDHFTSGFSRGSSFPYQDYRCLLDRGELTSRLCPTSLDHTTPTTLDATGLGFAGNPPPGCAFGAPEEIPVYDPAPWSWSTPSSGIVAPSPLYAAAPEVSTTTTGYLGMSSRPSGDPQSSPFSTPPTTERYDHPAAPSAQLPTPAAMAILLNPQCRSDREHSQSGYSESHFESSPLVGRHVSAALRPFIRREGPVQNQGTSEGLSREKKHACTMCHKRFDRPSTLKKHLLVHTGEKAFVCDTCGRRFGVASNLNRHVKRCILKPVNSNSPSHKSTTSGSPPSLPDSPDAFLMSSPNQTAASLGKRSRTSSVTSPELSPPTNVVQAQGSSASANGNSTKVTKPPGQKRRRRAPSPSQWVPETLQSFNLLSEDSYRVTQVPLPPVRRNLPYEERDSWDENVNQTPYHPCGWRGILPGPGLGHGLGLGGKDVRNLDLGGRGGFMLGRVLVF